MMDVVKLLTILILLVIYSASKKSKVDAQMTVQELELAQHLIFEDISNIKRKLWIDLSSKLATLETKLEHMENNRMCNVNGNNDLRSSDKLSQDNRQNTTMATILLRSFHDEKLKLRKLNKLLQKLLTDNEELSKRFGDHDEYLTDLRAHMSIMDEFKDKDEQFNENIQQTVTDLMKSHEDLSRDVTILNDTLFVKSGENKHNVRKPVFVSEWILIRSQDPSLGERAIPHGLGEIPYKVDVQIRPTSGPNAGWIFSGDSAMQADDDLKDEVYGGVVYFYDSSNVYIMAPMIGNNFDFGRVLNTGATKNRRLGNNHQTSNEAYVRVKIWSPADFPKPDIESEWFPLDTDNSSLAYYELTHGLNEYPGFVNIQIRCTSINGDSELISEGIGSSASNRAYLNSGGVIHAFDKNKIRVWASHFHESEKYKAYNILGGFDGWNRGLLKGINANRGQFRVLVWNRLKFVDSSQNSNFEQIEENVNFPEWSPFDKFSPQTDLLSFYAQANDGLNKGFRFPGYGNSQSTGPSSFGGVMYAYNSNGDIRIWRPNPLVDGYMIHVYEPYGNGNNHQRSNNASFVSTLLRTN
ncbi:hypothetical protein ACF0H5_014237 [Mactra antiquata]